MAFFSETTSAPFPLFGPLYFTLLFLVAAGIFLILHYRQNLRRFKYNHILRYSFAGILFANMTIYYGGLMLTGQYTVKKHLPLEFCFITGYILMYILVTNNKRGFYSTLFYCTIIGPLPAMIWPNIPGSYDRYIFWQFIISHHFMMLVSFYCIIVFQYEVKPKGALKTMVYGNVVFFAVSALNYFWGSNYIMQQKLPDHILRLFPFISAFNVPIFWLEFCGILMLGVGLWAARVLQKDHMPSAPPEQELCSTENPLMN